MARVRCFLLEITEYKSFVFDLEGESEMLSLAARPMSLTLLISAEAFKYRVERRVPPYHLRFVWRIDP